MAPSAIAKKLLIKPGHRVAILHPPTEYQGNLNALANGAELVRSPRSPVDTLLIFVSTAREIAGAVSVIKKLVGETTMLWIAYPKKSSGIKTDISRDSGWDPVQQAGYDGVALVSLDDTWSAMRFRPAEKVKRTSTRRAKAFDEKAKAPGGKAIPMGEKVGDAALKAKTGKTWSEWFTVLDKAGAAEMGHTHIASLLHTKHGVPGWWSQMITVGYEQARGLRIKHQTADGFKVTVSRVFPVSVTDLFAAFDNPRLRSKWLPNETITVSSATPNRSMRAVWSDGRTRLNILFYAKGQKKAQVAVEHQKLTSSRAAEEKKAYWAARLDALKGLLGHPVRSKN